MFDYTKSDILKVLKKVGLKKGDNVFCHSNIGFFGKLKDIRTKNQLCKIFYKSIFDIIGNKGNLIVPTFSYSFFRKKNFKKNDTLSNMGIFSEWVRKNKNSERSNDPNFSVSCIGPDKFFFCTNYSKNTYSDESFFHKFHQSNGKILNFNFPGSTIIHYYEKKLGINYRFDKKFSGLSDGKNETWTVFSRKLSSKSFTHNPFPITDYIKKRKIAYYTILGKGEVLCISSQNFFNSIKNVLKKKKFFLTQREK